MKRTRDVIRQLLVFLLIWYLKSHSQCCFRRSNAMNIQWMC
nr:MAG TPA: hypothetical protein [Caudoviricetes sp.]